MPLYNEAVQHQSGGIQAWDGDVQHINNNNRDALSKVLAQQDVYWQPSIFDSAVFLRC